MEARQSKEIVYDEALPLSAQWHWGLANCAHRRIQKPGRSQQVEVTSSSKFHSCVVPGTEPAVNQVSRTRGENRARPGVGEEIPARRSCAR